MHVVGSTNKHPEMIWATFEHVRNAPNQQYSYISSSSNAPTNKPADGPGAWLFSASGASSSGPIPIMNLGPNGSIVASGNATIGPVDVTRLNAWGSDPTAAETNTAVISINRSIIDQLAAGDVRKNYIMIGSIWTDGTSPVGNNLLGTTMVSNATMETFEQPGTCFDCHAGNMLGSTGGGGLSHIWGQIDPLFP
jgi:hypothetical protein